LFVFLVNELPLLKVKLLIAFAVNGEVVRPAHSEVENSVFSVGLNFFKQVKNTTTTAERQFHLQSKFHYRR